MSVDEGAPPGLLHDWLAHRSLVTLFPTLSASTFQTRLLTPVEIAQLIEGTLGHGDTIEAAKRNLPLMKMARFGQHKTPIRTDATGKRVGGSLRHDGNIEAITGIEGDYDAGIIAFDEAHERLLKRGVLCILYTSPSHVPGRERWRVIAPTSREIRGQEQGESTDRLSLKRTVLMNWLNGVFHPAGAFGAESWTFSQAFYYGFPINHPDPRVVVIDGTPIDLLPELELTRVLKPGAQPTQRTGPRLAARDGAAVDPNAIPEDQQRPPLDEEEAKRQIIEGTSMHPMVMSLIGKWVFERVPGHEVWARIEAILDSCAPEIKATDRWKARKAEVPALVEYGIGKEMFKKAERARQRAEARQARAEAQKREARAAAPDDERPEIELFDGQRHRAADLALKTLFEANVPFYVRGTSLVHIVPVKSKTSEGGNVALPGIVAVSKALVTRELTRVVRWTRFDPRAGVMRQVNTPPDVVEQILAMITDWPFHILRGVIGTPTMRPDGSILSKPGYDIATGLYLYKPPRLPPIPDTPTWRDAEGALTLLNSLLDEFPFTDIASRSVAMSMIMTTVLRGGLGDAVPMHVVDAPAPGTGKSYLADVASAIALGERASATAVAPDDPKETEKRLIAAAIVGRPIISIDNCNGVLSGDFLAQATSGALMSVRPLGTSDTLTIANTFTVFANGNNIVIQADLVRRSVRCSLDANLADPTSRTFQADPVAAVLADQGRYVAAVLTIARAYHCAGYPNPPHLVPGFAAWSRLVCGALTWLHWANPAETTQNLRFEDPAMQSLTAVIETFPRDQREYSAQQLVDAANETWDGAYTNPDWREAILPVCRNGRGDLDALRLAQWLGHRRGMTTAKGKLVRTGTATRPRWGVQRS